ncbi:MAG: YczE/YyaS/YitT family protein, partial [Actinomycetota bacterium]
IVLALWLPLKERPGFGTFSNILIVASAIDLGLHIFPEQELLPLRYLYVFVGIALVGIGSAFYITCGLGPGPRDGWMTALHNRTGVRVGRVRLGIEVLVLTLGWLLGGTLGIGTALFALLIGQSIAISFGVVSRITPR